MGWKQGKITFFGKISLTNISTHFKVYQEWSVGPWAKMSLKVSLYVTSIWVYLAKKNNNNNVYKYLCKQWFCLQRAISISTTDKVYT